MIREAHAGLGPEWTIRLAVLYFHPSRPGRGASLLHDFDKLTRIVTTLAARMALDVDGGQSSHRAPRAGASSYLADELARQAGSSSSLRERAVALSETTARARRKSSRRSPRWWRGRCAHEIGTPMSVIQGHAKMLEGSAREAATREWRLQTIRIRSRASRASSTPCSRSRTRARSRSEQVELAPAARPDVSIRFRAVGEPRRA